MENQMENELETGGILGFKELNSSYYKRETRLFKHAPHNTTRH